MVDDGVKKEGPGLSTRLDTSEAKGNPAAGLSELEKALATQEKLQAQVDRMSHELKDFAYLVSHDLKAPLRAIKTLIDWISTDYADRLDAEGREQLMLLVGRVDRMHRLLDGVLEYSRIGRIREPLTPVNLNEVVPELIDAMNPPGPILVTVESQLPVIEAEPSRIRQVFEHLIGNAIRFMDKPQGLVRVRCAAEGGSWLFSVSDNGCGIKEEHFERIFKIFQTLAPKDQCDSTGMGLTLVKKIVDLHGGRVWVESKVGEGSTFWFTWPKVPVADLAPVEAAV